MKSRQSNSLSSRTAIFLRVLACLVAVAATSIAHGESKMAISGVEKSEKAKSEPKGDPPIQSLQLAHGQVIYASIKSYSLQSRVITLQLPAGQIRYIAPQDLTAFSKLKWLASPAFRKAIENYHPPRDALSTIIKVLAGPVMGTFVTAFLVFWLSVALVSSEKKIGRAGRTYIHSIIFASLVFAAALMANFGASVALQDSPMAPAVHFAIVAAAFIVAITRISAIIADDYSVSGGAGLLSVMLSLFFGACLALGTLYFLPRSLQNPGVDDWLTDRLLVPLGIA